jgi:hypothetical protein
VPTSILELDFVVGMWVSGGHCSDRVRLVDAQYSNGITYTILFACLVK